MQHGRKGLHALAVCRDLWRFSGPWFTVVNGTTPASLVRAKHVIVPGAARRYAPPRRWQFDSRQIYVRPRTDPQSAHGKAAGSQRVYRLGQLRA